MRIVKRAAAVLLTITTAAGLLAGCGSGAPKEETFPEYEDDKQMVIGGWDVPMNTLEDYQMAKDMGLTHMFIDGVFEARGSDGYCKQLEYCEQVGLKAIVGMDTSLDNDNNTPIDTFDYSAYPAVERINVWDEPSTSKIADVLERVEYVNKTYEGTGVSAFVNLDPSNHRKQPTDVVGTGEYLKEFNEKVISRINGKHILCTDVYPLSYARGEYYLLTIWLERLSQYAKAAKEYDADFEMFIQSYSANDTRDLQGREDLTFQIYTCMAFGITGYHYFTYRASFLDGFGGGCVANDQSCSPTEIYYWAQEVNEEINKFDHVYLSFDWDGAMGILGTDNVNEDPTYGNGNFTNIVDPLHELRCASAVTGTQDTLIGQFMDEEGRDGLIVVNFTDPVYGLKDAVHFEFKDANRAVVYRNGERKIYEVKDNQLDLTLACGEGVFIIPVKN